MATTTVRRCGCGEPLRAYQRQLCRTCGEAEARRTAVYRCAWCDEPLKVRTVTSRGRDEADFYLQPGSRFVDDLGERQYACGGCLREHADEVAGWKALALSARPVVVRGAIKTGRTLAWWFAILLALFLGLVIVVAVLQANKNGSSCADAGNGDVDYSQCYP